MCIYTREGETQEKPSAEFVIGYRLRTASVVHMLSCQSSILSGIYKY
jgi:hypothetical protein